MADPTPLPTAPRDWNRRTFLTLGLFALGVLGVNLATSSSYGITSDEPVIHMGGVWQLWAMSSDVPDRWNFKRSPPPEVTRLTRFTGHPDNMGHYIFPGFPGFFCAAVATVARHLPGYTEIDAVHAGLAILHALAVLALGLYLTRLFGLRRALFTVILFALFPSAAGQSHYNIKDWPCAEFYALSCVAFLVGAVEDRVRFYLQSAVWLGLGLASKANPVFVFPTLLLWMPLAAYCLYRDGRRPKRWSLVAVCLLPNLATLVFYAAWPYLHSGTAKEQWDKFAEVVSFFMTRARTDRDTFSPYPFLLLATMTPPIELLGLALAAVLPFRSTDRREAAAASLGLIWIVIPLVRIALPHSNYYDGNRHFLEYVPALAMLAAQGLDLGIGWLEGQIARRRDPRSTGLAGRGLLVAVMLLAAWPTLQYHPFESTYYNLFVGGLGGAQARQLTRPYVQRMEFWAVDSETDYWGYSYRDALRVVGEVAEKNASFAPCGNLIGPLTPFQHARPDLRQSSKEGADFFVVIPRGPFCSEDERRYVRENAEIVKEERRDGGLIYGVYRRKRG